MRYIVAGILCLLLLLVPSMHTAAQGYRATTNCDGGCSFFHLALSVIPTTGDPAADMAGLIAMGSTLLTLARLVQASTMQRSKSVAPISDLEDNADEDERISMDSAETTQG